MIIQSARILASDGAQETADHVLRGKMNERIVVIQGCERDLFDMVEDARRWRRDYGFRHYKLNPQLTVTQAQLREALEALAAEAGYDAARALVVGHVKKRFEDKGSEFHVHVLAPEVNPVNGRVLCSRTTYARQERVARLLELAWGHPIVQGRFNGWVLDTLRATGRGEEADALLAAGLDPEAEPQAGYPSGLVQEVRRKTKRELPEVQQMVREMRMLSSSPQEFARLLEDNRLRVRPGDKAARWVVEARGGDGAWSFAGALHRLLKERTATVEEWIGNWKPEGGEHVGGHGRTAAVGGRRVRRAAGWDGRTTAPEGSGQAGDDSRRGGRAGRGKRGEQADEPAGQPRARGGRDGAGQDRRAARRGRRAAAGHERAPERPSADALAQGGAGGGRAGKGGGRRSYLGPVAAAEGGGTSLASGSERRAPGALVGRGGRLGSLLAVAALEARLGEGEGRERLESLVRTGRREPLRSLPEGTENRTVRCAEDDRLRRERQVRFRALLLRRAYVLSDHLPVEAVLNLRRVDVDPSGRFVLLTLWSGTQLLDTGDRITVRGQADDVAIHELVACAERRGWQAVEVEGTEEFRAEASRALLLRGIDVVDCPLSEAEMAALRGEGPGFDWSSLEAQEAAPAPMPPWAS